MTRTILALLVSTFAVATSAFAESNRSAGFESDLLSGRAIQENLQVEANDGPDGTITLPKGRIFITDVVCNLNLDQTNNATVRMVAQATIESGMTSNIWTAPIVDRGSNGQATASFQFNVLPYVNNKKSVYSLRFETTGAGSECNLTYLRYK